LRRDNEVDEEDEEEEEADEAVEAVRVLDEVITEGTGSIVTFLSMLRELGGWVVLMVLIFCVGSLHCL